MKLTDEEVLEIIKSFNDIAEWWYDSEDEELPFRKGPVSLVERINGRTYDSWSGWQDGELSMVFLFGERYYKVEVDYSSFGESTWNNPRFKQVTPKTRSVSYYE